MRAPAKLALGGPFGALISRRPRANIRLALRWSVGRRAGCLLSLVGRIGSSRAESRWAT